MKLPLSPLETHTIKTLAILEGVDPADEKAMGSMVTHLAQLKIDEHRAAFEDRKKPAEGSVKP